MVSKHTQISNFIHPSGGGELFHASKRKDMSKLMDDFRNSVKAPDNSKNTNIQTYKSRQYGSTLRVLNITPPHHNLLNILLYPNRQKYVRK
jgi:hypothetical protein